MVVTGRHAHFASFPASICGLLIMALCMGALLALPASAYGVELDEPELTEADAAVLLDKGGNVLYAKEPEKREHPASITKVMTAMCVLDSGHKLDEVVDITAPDLGENSQMGDYATGDKITLGELLQVMLVYSGNDAAWNAGVYVAGSEEAFVDLMNKKAAQIGMDHTHFANCHGLEDDNHYSCAYDIALMGCYALEHYPYIAQTVVRHTVEAHVYDEVLVLNSTDRLLDTFDGIRGIKTGAIVNNYTFLGASGRGNTQLYTSVLGCQTFMGRFDDAAALMEWGYEHYQDKVLTRGNWVTRVEPYALDLGQKAILVSEQDFTGSVWPSMGKFGYSTVLNRPHHLLDVGQTYGWTSWRQSGSDLGFAYYTTRPAPQAVSSWPVFELPLFSDVSTLGRLS